MKSVDLVAFPAGTGIGHHIINNSQREALLLVGGEVEEASNRICYPLDQSCRADLKESDWWHDAPSSELGDCDGLPDLLFEAKVLATRVNDWNVLG